MVVQHRQAQCRHAPLKLLADVFTTNRERLRRAVEARIGPALASRMDFDDVLQESWLAASQRLQHLPDCEATTVFWWLRRIVLQTLVDVQRRHAVAQSRTVYRERYLSDSTNSFPVVDERGQTASAIAVEQETAAELWSVIQGMSELDREILTLRHYEELSNDEVAAVLGIAKNTASNRYVRALARLKDRLSHTILRGHQA